MNKYIKMAEMMLTMLGAIAGVGFVTGVEIEDFFAKFGINYIFGIIVLFVLIWLLVCKILPCDNNLQIDLKMQNYSQITPKNTLLIKNHIRQMFLFFNLTMMSSAMISGLRVMLIYLLKHNYIFVYFALILFVFLLLIFGIRGIAKFNYFIIAFLVFVFVFLFFGIAKCDLTDIAFVFSFKETFASGLFAIIYVFMNIVEIEPVAREYGLKFNNRDRWIFSFIFAFIVSALVVIICLFLQCNRNFAKSEMPILLYFDGLGAWCKILFCVGVVISLISTLLTCLIGVKRFITDRWNVMLNIVSSFLALVISLIIGVLPFSFFTKIIYPIIGVLNFVIFVFL